MSGAKVVFNSVRNFSTIAVATAIIFSAIFTITIGAQSLEWQVAIAIIALVVGIPHGAIDHLVALPKTSKFRLFLLIVVYVAIALIAVIALLNWNRLGFQIVLLMSALHFGFGDAAFIAELDRLENRPRMRFKVQNMYAITVGVVPVFIPLLKGSTASALKEINPILIGWASDIAAQIIFLICFFIFLTFVLLLKDRRIREILDLVFLLGLALVAPPLISFAIYFGCWHAMRHTARLTLILPKAMAAANSGNPKQSFLAAVIPGLPALAGTVFVAVVITMLDSKNLNASYLWYLLVVVWALTVPHMVVTAKIDKQALA